MATQCVECGFCEPVCPSRNVTTTPRQRIVLRREMARQPDGSPVLETLLREYEYDAIETCAADGTCMNACPVAIDTGKLIKAFRAEERTDREESAALSVARRYAAVERAARGGLRAAEAVRGALGGGAVRGVAETVRRAVSRDLVPTYPDAMPPPAPARLPDTVPAGAAAVYLPACVNRIFGNPRDAAAEPTLPEALVEVSRRAGMPLWIPPDVAGHCCATPWSSKGYRLGQEHMARHTAEALWRWTDGGRLPVVTDASSCAHGLIQDVGPVLDEDAAARFCQIEVLDSTVWAHDHLLPHLDVRERVASVAVHPTCSAGPHGGAGQAGGRDGRAGRRGGGAHRRRLLRDGGRPRAAPPRAARVGAARREGEPRRARVRRSRVLQPHLRDRAPAGDRDDPTRRSCSCWNGSRVRPREERRPIGDRASTAPCHLARSRPFVFNPR